MIAGNNSTIAMKMAMMAATKAAISSATFKRYRSWRRNLPV
jgi:hypothetical protein